MVAFGMPTKVVHSPMFRRRGLTALRLSPGGKMPQRVCAIYGEAAQSCAHVRVIDQPLGVPCLASTAPLTSPNLDYQDVCLNGIAVQNPPAR
jgi:hypothetical protein